MKKWANVADAGTAALVDLATLAFAFLLGPQIARNAASLSANAPAALAALSPSAHAAAGLANAALLIRFLTLRERGAATVQALGVAANAVVLVQLASAGLLGPRSPLIGRAVAAAAAAVLSAAVLQATGALDSAGVAGDRAWRTVSGIVGVAAVTAVPACLAATVFGAGTSVPAGAAILAAATATALFLAQAAGRLGPRAGRAVASAPAWAATALFILQPVAAAARAARVATAAASRAGGPAAAAASLTGVSAATLALAALGNALCVPRSVFTRDKVWLVGAAWGAAAGWAQLAGLAVVQGRALAGGFPAAPAAHVLAALSSTMCIAIGGGLALVRKEREAAAAAARVR